MFAFLSLLCFQSVFGSNIFSSQVGFDSLLITEKLLLSNLEKYVEATQEKLMEINSIIESISSKHPENQENLEEYLSNPIRAFSLLKRLVITWPEIRDTLEENIARENYIQVKSIHQAFKLKYPKYSDFAGAAEALARIQDTYNLNIQEFTEGIINGKKSSESISWTDCFHIAHTLYNSELYKFALTWAKESERKMLLSSDYIGNFTRASLYDNIAAINFKLGNVEDASEAIEKLEILYPNYPFFSKELMKKGGETAPITYKDSIEYDIYQKVCRDEIKPSPRQQKNLRCRYKTDPEPFLKLAPFKMEELSLDPFVVIIYNAISDNEIDFIKSYAQPYIRESVVVGHKGLVSHRISKNTWMPYEDFDILKGISQRITDLTGLSMSQAEHFQVVNYGIGGHYEPHTDGFQNMSLIEDTYERGNRIATALFYLSDVEMGGSTTFPYLGVNVKAEKGKLLYWNNLHTGGKLDFRTKHAGCPVVLGNKWIANAWLRSIDQAFRRPCTIRNDNGDSAEYEEVTYI